MSVQAQSSDLTGEWKGQFEIHIASCDVKAKLAIKLTQVGNTLRGAFVLSNVQETGCIIDKAGTATGKIDGSTVYLKLFESEAFLIGQLENNELKLNNAETKVILSRQTNIPVPPENPQIKISVNVTKNELNILNDETSTILVTVLDQNNKPVKNHEIKIEICAARGGYNDQIKDGHLHPKMDLAQKSASFLCKDDPNKTSRPNGQIVQTGKIQKEKLPSFKTDSTGTIKLLYTSPKSRDKASIPIAGIDKILIKSESAKLESQIFITSKVPNLIQMEDSLPDSTKSCGSGIGYTFQRQSNHGCMFFGTDETVNSLVRIGQEFNKLQKDCATKECDLIITENTINSTTGVLTGKSTPAQKTVKIKGPPQAMEITAMSLPWGGLLDIGPSTKAAPQFWKAPHYGHSDGTEVDISFSKLDLDRKILLKNIIENHNTSPKKWDYFNEGGNILDSKVCKIKDKIRTCYAPAEKTNELLKKCNLEEKNCQRMDHFHVNFMN